MLYIAITAAVACIGIFACLILWFTTRKLKIITNELKSMKSQRELSRLSRQASALEMGQPQRVKSASAQTNDEVYDTNHTRSRTVSKMKTFSYINELHPSNQPNKQEKPAMIVKNNVPS